MNGDYDPAFTTPDYMMSLEEETIQLERCASPDIEWLSRILSPEIFSLEADSNLCHSHDGTKRKMLKLKSGYHGHREERLRRLGLLPGGYDHTVTFPPSYDPQMIIPKQEVIDDEYYMKPDQDEEDEEERNYIDLSETGQTSVKPNDLKVSVDDDKGVVVEMYGMSYPIDISTDLQSESAAKASSILHNMNTTRMRGVFDNNNEYKCSVIEPVCRKKAAKNSSRNYPRFKRLPRGCRLWEFIRDLLHNPRYNPSHIRWTDISRGEFRLIKTHDIARMWGEKKNNEGMTYEKLSRAMRYYYKRQILAPVLGKRLIYRFGPKSYGWN